MLKGDLKNALVVGAVMAGAGYMTPLAIVSAAVAAVTMVASMYADINPAVNILLTLATPALFWGAVGTIGSLICTRRPTGRRPA